MRKNKITFHPNIKSQSGKKPTSTVEARWETEPPRFPKECQPKTECQALKPDAIPFSTVPKPIVDVGWKWVVIKGNLGPNQVRPVALERASHRRSHITKEDSEKILLEKDKYHTNLTSISTSKARLQPIASVRLSTTLLSKIRPVSIHLSDRFS